jgi:hypothetical protein
MTHSEAREQFPGLPEDMVMSDRNPLHIRDICNEDAEGLMEAAKSYGDSWKKRGGVGAFMMLCRKWDRLEVALNPDSVPGDVREAPIAARLNKPIPAFDIFAALEADDRAEGLIDDVRDLRRYLILVEAEMRRRGVTSALTTHRDNEGEGVCADHE